MPKSVSPPKTARKPQQRSVETVDQILAATVAVIEAVGVHKLTIDMVATQAGISKGGILHHFPAKSAVVVAAVRRNMEKLIADIEDTARSTRTFTEALALHVRRIAREKGGVSPALFVAMAEFPEAAEAVHGMFGTLQRLVAADGEAGSAERNLFLFAAFGILVGRGMNFFSPSEEELEGLFQKLDGFAATDRR
ncbi:TetR/AcrR family transcriptional regulator [Labrys monachus]|uniref:AcrR family transcriptional regulator n=1 Tax=Labrys monachus TaxID=217067 RepID=A0ABU0F847_9HYPH|nr:TetR/AcrR family transcriptional regulator [Labrys monachus]MDQ0390788.1 AcrR family transcriptional regulator [Labrys monachus]